MREKQWSEVIHIERLCVEVRVRKIRINHHDDRLERLHRRT